MQEEIRQNTIDGTSSKHDDEEKCALDRKENKVKGKKSQSKGDSSQSGKKKDFSKIKFFHCNVLGHYATKCLHKKFRKKPLGESIGEALPSQFKLDFTLIACMVTSIMSNVWYLNSGASFHMTSNKKKFSDLEEKDL